MTLLVECHAWRGFSAAGGSLLYIVTCGFVTFGFAPFQITKRLNELTEKLKQIVS